MNDTTPRPCDQAAQSDPATPLGSVIDGPRRRHWFVVSVLAAAVAVFTTFFGLGGLRSFGSHEVFAVEPARDMLRSGDWIVPRFGGLPRLQKPPLAYWVVATSGALFGDVNEWTARFPAAASSLALSALMGFWAWRWYGPVAGLAALIAQATSLYAVIFARKAEIDMPLCLLTTVSLFLVAHQPADESRRRAFARWAGIYALLSLAWLAKFHYGPVMVLAPTFVFFAVQKRFGELRNLLNPIGMLLFAASALVWPTLILNQVPNAWDVWNRETVGRALGALGREPFWYYAPKILWLTLPWTPYAIAAIPRSWRTAWPIDSDATCLVRRIWNGGGDSRERFLWIWFLTVFVIVTISARKHAHYLAAAVPMVSILVGQQFARLAGRIDRGERLLSVRLACALAASAGAGAVVAVAVCTRKWPHVFVPITAAGVILGTTGIAVSLLVASRRAIAAVYVGMACLLLGTASLNGWLLPGCDPQTAVADFAHAIRRKLPPETEIAVYKMGMHAIVYYLDAPVHRYDVEDDLSIRLESAHPLLVVTTADHLGELGRLGSIRRLTVADELGVQKTSHRNALLLVELKADRQVSRNSGLPAFSAPPRTTAQDRPARTN